MSCLPLLSPTHPLQRQAPPLVRRASPVLCRQLRLCRPRDPPPHRPRQARRHLEHWVRIPSISDPAHPPQHHHICPPLRLHALSRHQQGRTRRRNKTCTCRIPPALLGPHFPTWSVHSPGRRLFLTPSSQGLYQEPSQPRPRAAPHGQTRSFTTGEPLGSYLSPLTPAVALPHTRGSPTRHRHFIRSQAEIHPPPALAQCNQRRTRHPASHPVHLGPDRFQHRHGAPTA